MAVAVTFFSASLSWIISFPSKFAKDITFSYANKGASRAAPLAFVSSWLYSSGKFPVYNLAGEKT